MKTRVDRRLRDESDRFAFRFACDHCAHFDAGTDRCSLGYPAEPRCGAIVLDQTIELCKAFELG